jgi:hypothetical protein
MVDREDMHPRSEKNADGRGPALVTCQFAAVAVLQDDKSDLVRERMDSQAQAGLVLDVVAHFVDPLLGPRIPYGPVGRLQGEDGKMLDAQGHVLVLREE